MIPTSDTSHALVRRVVIAVLVVASTALVVWPAAPAPAAAVESVGGGSSRALDALRAGSFSLLHTMPRLERLPSPSTAPSPTGALLLLAVAALGWLPLQIEGRTRSQPRWWHGCCRRAPPSHRVLVASSRVRS